MATHLVDIDVACSQATPKAETVSAWVEVVLNEFPSCSIAFKFVEPEESQALNLAWRGKDKPTNVLSFPGEELPGAEEFVLGDIVICPAVLETEALEQGKEIDAHWAHLVVHGLLHLRGYDHIDDQEAEEMEALERQILATFSISDPYAIVV